MEGYYLEAEITDNNSYPSISLYAAKFKEEYGKLILHNNEIYAIVDSVFPAENIIKLNSVLYNKLYRCIPEDREFKIYYNKNNNKIAIKFKHEDYDQYEILIIDKKEIEDLI
jgi:hypothetical protein